MPQFKPLWWINLLSWTFAILALITRYHHAISFPATLRILVTRMSLLFHFYMLVLAAGFILNPVCVLRTTSGLIVV